MRYSVQSRNLIFVKCYGFFHFAENMVKNIGKNISKNLNGNYSQKLLDHAKQFATDALKTSLKKVIQKKSGDLVASKITRVSKNSQQNNL